MKLYKLMKKPPSFLSVSTWITDEDDPVQPGPNARRAIIIPLLEAQYGSLSAKLKGILPARQDLVTIFTGMRESARGIQRNPGAGKRSMDPDTRRELEAYARELGVSTIGYARVNPDFIFQDFEILCDGAMMLTIEMNKEAIDSGPSLECMREVIRTYAALGVAVNELADWLRERGYDCHPSPAMGGDINTVPTAQDANLGFVGRNGILITPEFGPCARLAALFIDVDDLPVAEGNDHQWVAEFCETCKRCIKTCPAGAILEEPRVLEDGTLVFIEPEKCVVPFSEGCSVCISSCVFTGGHYERLKDAWLRRQQQPGDQPGASAHFVEG
jgi:epoxyqueuosine reductase